MKIKGAFYLFFLLIFIQIFPTQAKPIEDYAPLIDQKFHITAYDLSVQSTGKSMSHPEYGITYTGFSLEHKSLKKGDRYVAVDPDVIPLGSFIYIQFEDADHEKYDGIYQAVDTGNFPSDTIDIFIGDFQKRKPAKETIDFGRVDARVWSINFKVE